VYGEEEEEEEFTIIFADTAREAAEEFAMRRDGMMAEFNGLTIVEVCEPQGWGEDYLFEVEGRLEPAYSARDITGKAVKI
jgi:hypothetical protein